LNNKGDRATTLCGDLLEQVVQLSATSELHDMRPLGVSILAVIATSFLGVGGFHGILLDPE
jgi:hypothetical protein